MFRMLKRNRISLHAATVFFQYIQINSRNIFPLEHLQISTKIISTTVAVFGHVYKTIQATDMVGHAHYYSRSNNLTNFAIKMASENGVEGEYSIYY